MLQKFDAHDRVLSQNRFMADEVPYNLILRICEAEGSIRLKASDETMIFARSEGSGYNAWLWIARDVADDRKDELIRELIAFLKDVRLPGITGEPTTVERFAQLYSEAAGLRSHPTMLMETYYCPQVKKPLHVRGTL